MPLVLWRSVHAAPLSSINMRVVEPNPDADPAAILLQYGCSLPKPSFKTTCHEHRSSEQLPLSARCRDKLRKIVMSVALNCDRHLE